MSSMHQDAHVIHVSTAAHTWVVDLRFLQELLRDLVSSYRVDFQLSAGEAIQEALEELRLQGIECDRALYEDFDRSLACLSTLAEIAEATGANDTLGVESSIRQLHELSPGLEFYVDKHSFVRYAEQLVSAIVLVADNPQTCDLAFRILHRE